MKLIKKVLCLMLAVLMLLSVTACSGDTGASSTPAATQSGNNGGSSGTSGNAKYDFGGKTLKVAVWYEPEKPSLGDSDAGDAWYYSLKNACEEYNCEVEWIVDTYENHLSNFIQKSLAGEVYADIFMSHSWCYVSLIDQGLILPTTEYIANAEDAEYWEQGLYQLKGENWGLNPRNTNYTPTYYLLINTKVLNSLGLEHPQELVKRGEWTWDKFREYCVAATDPSIERHGVACFSLDMMLKSANGFDFAVEDENGVYQNGFTYEKTAAQGMEILDMIQKMGQQDKSIRGTWTAGQEAFDDAVNAFKDGKVLFAFYPNPETLKKSGFEDYSVVTVPVGPSAEGLTETVDAFAFWSLPKESNFPADARAAFWMEAKRTWDPSDEEGYYEASEDDVLNELWDTKWITEADAQFMLDMGKGVSFKPGINVSWGTLITDEIFGAVIRGEITPAAAIEQKAGQMQALIDATYNRED